VSGTGRSLRVVLDTNLFVSALLFRGSLPDAVLTAWGQYRFTLVTSHALLEELVEVLNRPRFRERYRLSEEDVGELLERLLVGAEFIDFALKSPITVRDPKDEKVVGCAVGGRADYLVSGDQDLLVLDGEPALGALRMITPREFLSVLGIATHEP
jgi:putative PIN family toxin of toxin-antitoxin system